VGVLLCLVTSVLFTAGIQRDAEIEPFARSMIAAVALPLILGVPIFAYMSRQLLELWRTNRQLEASARYDGLTKLLNRSAFTSIVEGKLAEMSNLSSARGALLIIDADHFKSINDTWGHATGDDALRRIAEAMAAHLHRDDVLGRLGGEEFGAFFYGSSRAAVEKAAENMRAAVEAVDLVCDGERVPVTISLGGVHFGEALPFEALYRMADTKLYEAKANGRNRVAVGDAGLEAYDAAA
jgi:diguanylate cyclase